MDVFQTRLAEALKTALETLVTSETQRLADTPAEDYQTYMRRIGYIKGVQQSLHELETLVVRLNKDEPPTTVAVQSFQRRYEE
jgi:hypothetical protein